MPTTCPSINRKAPSGGPETSTHHPGSLCLRVQATSIHACCHDCGRPGQLRRTDWTSAIRYSSLSNAITVSHRTATWQRRLLRAFFLITNTDNYQNHDLATNPGREWKVTLPAVPVLVTGGVPARLMLPVELAQRLAHEARLQTREADRPSRPRSRPWARARRPSR